VTLDNDRLSEFRFTAFREALEHCVSSSRRQTPHVDSCRRSQTFGEPIIACYVATFIPAFLEAMLRIVE
jgi:hypothetical protein